MSLESLRGQNVAGGERVNVPPKTQRNLTVKRKTAGDNAPTVSISSVTPGI